MNAEASPMNAACGSGVSLSCLCILLVLPLLSVPAWAVDPDRNISQYAHTAWRVQDGFFPGTPNAIAQTKDGYLWIGTNNGLLRFDGVRFTPWVLSPGKKSNAQSIFALHASKDGGLWIGMNSSVARWTGKELLSFPVNGRVDTITEDERGIPWIVMTRIGEKSGPLCDLNDGKFRCHGMEDGIPIQYSSALARSSQGDFWIGDTSNLVRWHSGPASEYPIAGLKNAEGLGGVQALALDQDNTLWVGMEATGKGLGLERFINGRFESFVSRNFDSSQIDVSALFVDRDHALWIGTNTDGIYRIHGGKVEHFRSSDGLSGDTVNSFAQDDEGNIWVVTSRGADSFRDLPVITYSHQEGLTADSAGSVVAASDGTIWIGNIGGLDHLVGGAISSLRFSHGLPGRRVTSLFQDQKGDLWAGIGDGMYVFRGGHFEPVPMIDGTPTGWVGGFAEDENKDIWAAVYQAGKRRLIRIRSGKAHVPEVSVPEVDQVFPDPGGGVWITFDTGGFSSIRHGQLDASLLDRTKSLNIRGLLADSDDLVWAASSSGLRVLNRGVLTVLNEQNGLPCNSIFTIARDKADAIWIYARCGLIRIDKTDWAQWLANPTSTIKTHVFGVLCGAEPAATSFLPASATSPDGRLWFVNDSVLQMIDPQHLHLNRLPPPVHIERLLADGKDYFSVDKPKLPARSRNIEIDYTALSFVMPQAVGFRYKLEGRDDTWLDAGTRRQAFYNDLRPGQYRFHVMASNNDHVWNETGDTLDFAIPPAWYQTYWFTIACVLFILWLTFALYRLRMRTYAKTMGMRFDDRLRERTRLARELHDTLLQTIQGSKMVADEAREVGTDPARMRATLDRLSEWLERAMMEGRAALDSLRTSTLETNDLSLALQDCARDCELGHAVEVHISVLGAPRDMHPIAREEVLRIGSEAIRNACVHSGGSHVSVKLEYQPYFSLQVRDDGHGIDHETLGSGKKGHFGLMGMRERADRIGGKLTITSAPDGTKVNLVVPGGLIFKTK